LDISEKFCPICKNKNPRIAIICIHCGAFLDEDPTSSMATVKTEDGQLTPAKESVSSYIDVSLIPDDGICIYVVSAQKPYYLGIDKEITIGRRMEDVPEAFLDLSDVGGYALGVSRLHAVIRRTEAGYELVDLASTNGTWLNNDKLVPDKPYPLINESQIRLGRMQIYVIYRSLHKDS